MRDLGDGVAPKDGSVDAQPQIAAIGFRYRTTEAGAEAAGHRRLHRQLTGHSICVAEGPDRLDHCRGAAGVDDCGSGVVAGEHRREEVGYVAPVAGVAVLGRQADVGAEGVAGAEELVTGTSLGTNPVEPLYRWTPTAEQVSYGVGAWLLAASETLQLLESAPGLDA